MLKKLNILISGLALLTFLAGCSDPAKPTWEFMYHMGDSPAVKAQEAPMRLPPAGTLPRGFTPYPYKQDQGELAGVTLTNPLALTTENFLRGQEQYDIFCAVCHGKSGTGDGFIVPKFPRPPTLISEKVLNWSDGRIFHIITQGQNLMPSYAGQINIKDRWAIALYLRALQRAEKPTEADIQALKDAVKDGTYPKKLKNEGKGKK